MTQVTEAPAEVTVSEGQEPTGPSLDQVLASDDFVKAAHGKLVTLISERNNLAEQLKAAGGDRDATIESLITTGSDEQIAKLNERYEQLDLELAKVKRARQELAEKLADDKIANSKGNIDALTTQTDALDAAIKPALNMLKSLLDETAFKVVHAGLPELVGRKGRATPGKQGGGDNKRIRGFEFRVDGKVCTAKDSKGVERSNASAAAREAGVSTDVMQKAYWDAQGSTDPKAWRDRVEFQVTGPDNKVHEVVAIRLTEEQTPQAKTEQ